MTGGDERVQAAASDGRPAESCPPGSANTGSITSSDAAIGVVFKGHDEQIDRPLAIKTLRPEILIDMGRNDEVLRRFAAEPARRRDACTSNIVTVFDFVEHEGAPYIVMEYVNAGTRQRDPARHVPPRPAGRRNHGAAPVRARLCPLQRCHPPRHQARKHLARRRPPSRFPTSAWRISRRSTSRRRAGSRSAPPNYMAPERFIGRPADPRSDLFSAGVVLLQLLTGAKPFVASDLPELMRKLLNEVPPSIQTFRPELWTEIDEVAQRALARNPEDRFQTAEAFIDALNAAIEARPNDNLPPLDLTELLARRRRSSRRS